MGISYSSAALGHPHPHPAAVPELPYHSLRNRATQAVNFVFISFCSAPLGDVLEHTECGVQVKHLEASTVHPLSFCFHFPTNKKGHQ